MLMLLSTSSMAFANEEVSANEADANIELFEFLGEIAGLESLGLDIDSMIDNLLVSEKAKGGTVYEN